MATDGEYWLGIRMDDGSKYMNTFGINKFTPPPSINSFKGSNFPVSLFLQLVPSSAS